MADYLTVILLLNSFYKRMEQFHIYQSANSNKESIKKSFIVHKTEFQTIIGSLPRRFSKDPVQHELILGRRGSGKTTLIKKIETDIAENLNGKYMPIYLAEEQASTYRLFDLWMEIIEELKRRFSFQADVKDYFEFSKELDYTKYLYRQIHEYCHAQQKQIVLFLDNFDRMIENFTGEISLFKDILINYNDLIIIAASTRIDERFWQQDKLFYKFFRIHHLEALRIDEIKTLLNYWAETTNMPEIKAFTANNPGKLQSVRIMTDASPRTFHFFMRLIVQNNYSVESVDYLKEIMDYASPLYQERLNNLPPQLRKTILEMAFIGEACNTKNLVKKCKMESKLISANLKTLGERGFVDKIETDNRNLLYRLSDRFFNVWLIMTQGNSEQKQKVEWLSIFLENWYDSSFFVLQNQKRPNAPKNENDGFSSFDLGTIDRVQTVYSDAEKYYLSAINKGQVGAFYNLGNLYVTQGNFEEAEKQYLSAIDKGHIGALYNLGLLYANQGKYSEAEKQYLSAAGKGDMNAMYNLGLSYSNQRKYAEAEKQYLSAIEKGHVGAMYNLGNLYVDKENFEEAEKQYLSAIEKGHAGAMYNLGNLYESQGKYVKAEKQYLSAIKRNHTDAMYNLGNLYESQGKYEKAEKYYRLAIKENDKNAYYNSVSLYYRKNIHKSDVLKYILQCEGCDDLRIIIELWNGIVEDIEERTLSIIKENADNLFWFIIELLIHQQKMLVLNLFNHPELGQILRDKLKVLHYVCLLLNEKTENNLILRIPPEIQSTIDEVIRYILEKEKFYGYQK